MAGSTYWERYSLAENRLFARKRAGGVKRRNYRLAEGTLPARNIVGLWSIPSTDGEFEISYEVEVWACPVGPHRPDSPRAVIRDAARFAVERDPTADPGGWTLKVPCGRFMLDALHRHGQPDQDHLHSLVQTTLRRLSHSAPWLGRRTGAQVKRLWIS